MLKTNKGSTAVPIAIVAAGLLIAAALYFALGNKAQAPAAPANGGEEPAAAVTVNVPGVQASDHILGNPDAEIVIIEYSDTECPFCKSHHESMHQVIDKYGADGKVAWVYRQLPLAQLHSKAPAEAQATECAASLGGNEAFWAFTDKVYSETPSNDGLDLSKLPDFAEEVGLDKAAFEACLASDTGKDVIEKHLQEALAATGGRIGTPHNVILFQGEQIPAAGYIPFEGLDQMIGQMLTGGEEQ